MKVYNNYYSLKYFITPDKKSFPYQIENACNYLENTFAPCNLCYGVSSASRYAPSKLITDRKKYLLECTKTKRWGFGMNDGLGVPASISIFGSILDKRLRNLNVQVNFPGVTWDRYERLFVDLGDILNANYSSFVTNDALVILATQFGTAWARHDNNLINSGLPKLDMFTFGGADNILQPMFIGWLNYWSETTCKYINFSGDKNDLSLVSYSYKTPKNAWFVKLTNTPLNSENPEHISALVAAYKRWPSVGVLRE